MGIAELARKQAEDHVRHVYGPGATIEHFRLDEVELEPYEGDDSPYTVCAHVKASVKVSRSPTDAVWVSFTVGE